MDQDARGQLRKHGIRFGQFTIFMPLLLKPAATRLRLVLWSLSKGLQEFPESPPPGLVTVPAMTDVEPGTDTMAGYRNAGSRAIRIDMLERLADMLRSENSRAGFEAKADMLSITGMTLEQFADLMAGLGYNAEKGERPKVKAAPVASEAPATDATPAEGEAAATTAEVAETEAPAAETTGTEAPAAETAAAPTPPAEPEIEIFYTFTWGRPRQGGGERRARPQGNAGGDRKGDAGQGRRPKGGKPGGPKGKGGPKRDQGAKTYAARPEKKDRIDPDNPFAAALMGLKDKT